MTNRQIRTDRTMDLLPLHIEYLLTRHDCVIVPGLGAFIASEREAYIDEEAGMISPRRREISFNSSVVTDDGLLTHSIARREGISYEDAKHLMASLAGKMASDLDKEGEVSVGMTGRLLKDSEGLVSFQPRRSAMLADILQDIRLEAMPVSETAHSTPAADAAEESVKEEEGMRTIRGRADRYVFTVSKRAVHAAAMVVAVLTVGLSLLVPINHDNEQKASVISIEDFFRRAVIADELKAADSAAVAVEENDSTIVVSEVKTTH